MKMFKNFLALAAFKLGLSPCLQGLRGRQTVQRVWLLAVLASGCLYSPNGWTGAKARGSVSEVMEKPVLERREGLRLHHFGHKERSVLLYILKAIFSWGGGPRERWRKFIA